MFRIFSWIKEKIRAQVEKAKQNSSVVKKIMQASEMADAGQFEEAIELLDRLTKTTLGELRSNVYCLRGMIYLGWARASDRDDAVKRLILACQEFAFSVQGNEGHSESHFHWASALTEYGKLVLPSQAEQAFEQSENHFSCVGKAKQENADFYYNQGNLFLEWSKIKPAKEAESFLERACKCYEKAITFGKNRHLEHLNWGYALTLLADHCKPELFCELYELAIVKYKQALQIKPDDLLVYRNISSACLRLGNHQEQGSLEYFKQSYFWSRKGIEQNLCDAGIYGNCANALYHITGSLPGNDRPRHWAEICEMCKQAIALDPTHGDAYNTWGLTVLDMAKAAPDADKEKLIWPAIGFLKEANKLSPSDFNPLNNLGCAYSLLAKIRPPKEQEALYKNSIAFYNQAIQIEPDKITGYRNCMIVLFRLTELKQGQEKNELYNQVITVCGHMERICPGSAAYNLACIYGVLGDKEKCREWLFVGQRYNTLETRKHVENDPDMNLVRNETWFKEIRWKDS